MHDSKNICIRLNLMQVSKYHPYKDIILLQNCVNSNRTVISMFHIHLSIFLSWYMSCLPACDKKRVFIDYKETKASFLQLFFHPNLFQSVTIKRYQKCPPLYLLSMFNCCYAAHAMQRMRLFI